ncbi:hypothetical protein [Phormidium pseudopriestleyi]|nr:hypothetical protein [Phormidium pseudopriestleyi]
MNSAQSLLDLIRWVSGDRLTIRTENLLIVQQRSRVFSSQHP